MKYLLEKRTYAFNTLDKAMKAMKDIYLYNQSL